MYKFLLCCRYLRTRYIALASIISVMLGVATLIVVNSVMQGFTGEMRSRMHSIHSDLTFQANSVEAIQDYKLVEEQISKVAGDRIEAMSPGIYMPALLYFDVNGQTFMRQIDLVGIDAKTQSLVSGYGGYLQHPENRKEMSFDLREDGYDIRDHQSEGDVPERKAMAFSGWKHRREKARIEKFERDYLKKEEKPEPVESPSAPGEPSQNPFAHRAAEASKFDMATQQHAGAVLGIAMTSYRDTEGKDHFFVIPGDDVKIMFYRTKPPLKVEGDTFTIVDFYESKMSEFDSKYVFVPIERMQELLGMYDPTSGARGANFIQIKLKPGADLNATRDTLRKAFPPELFGIYTWQDKQEALLAAVDLETTILNVLLFMIIAVAGFGILAIFYMIVVEKTRDIGILKSLGASSRGVMGIFLGYGLSLGIVGSGVGLVIGLVFVHYINEIANGLAWLTGRPVFDPSIYYFYKIPAVVEPLTVFWIVCGALLIAVAASVLPARRAARLHPVEALRYE